MYNAMALQVLWRGWLGRCFTLELNFSMSSIRCYPDIDNRAGNCLLAGGKRSVRKNMSI